MPIACPYCVRPLRTPGSGPVYSLSARTFSAWGHSSFAAPSMRFLGSATGSARPGSSPSHPATMHRPCGPVSPHAGHPCGDPDAAGCAISTLGCKAATAACRSLSGGWSWAKARHLLRECFDERGQQALQAGCVTRLSAGCRATIVAAASRRMAAQGASAAQRSIYQAMSVSSISRSLLRHGRPYRFCLVAGLIHWVGVDKSQVACRGTPHNELICHQRGKNEDSGSYSISRYGAFRCA
jgi:hypothetical protein